MFPFNNLPVELQREIFVVAARSERGSALRLVLVARRIKQWVQSYIYDLVTLGSDDTKLFLRTMNSVPPEFFAAKVRKLCLSVSVSAGNAERILKVCTGVVDLAFWVDYMRAFPKQSVAPFLSPLPLRRLSIELNHFISLFTDPKSLPKWCDALTHLDLILWKHHSSPIIPHLDKLLALTHLALRPRHHLREDHQLLTNLSGCMRLQVLIIFDEPDSEETVWSEDSRVVYMPYPPKIITEWEAQAKHDDGCSWSRAEELVRKISAERTTQGSTTT
ncbi:hypothetical protein BDN70DRAFT_991218 [Pholiota conissans]|uniref:Uncharacterized protein n=1 Tax=Pholiota conissans TaxID=109636 RepID=A0A9P5Z714_9AGAR|nr:hypothetical protein BDN70DRAFT_991218 [Pholiota conissans]